MHNNISWGSAVNAFDEPADNLKAHTQRDEHIVVGHCGSNRTPDKIWIIRFCLWHQFLSAQLKLIFSFCHKDWEQSSVRISVCNVEGGLHCVFHELRAIQLGAQPFRMKFIVRVDHVICHAEIDINPTMICTIQWHHVFGKIVAKPNIVMECWVE